LLVGWESGRVEKVLQGQTGEIRDLAFSPNGSRLAAAGMDRKIRIWDVATGRLEWILEGHAKELEGIAFSPDGQRLLSIGRVATT
jgi:WD40 repeat protein